jgi:predicted RNase H-like HicB family nuclease
MLKSPPYTFIIRKSKLEYVAVCIELNVSARGADLPEVQRNLMNAIQDYLECAQEESIVVEPMPLNELIEFLRDTSPWGQELLKDFQPLELNEVPVYG